MTQPLSLPATADDLLELLRVRGQARYGGEQVSQLAHALQTATLAEREGAGAPLVVAALLHDIGHLVHDLGDDAAARGIDATHEAVGDRFLAPLFDAAVTQPILLHVAAKRYLCAVEPGYFDGLSAASVRSLALQGGAFSPAAADLFVQRPHARDAVRLRRWDDAAKNPEMATPPLAHFRDRVASCLSRYRPTPFGQG